jgi:hypothetical protein
MLRDNALLLQVMSLVTAGPAVPSLLEEAWRLEPFVPPFTFSAFFSPEDTLLCVCAADAAQSTLAGRGTERGDPVRYVELTAGSGLVGLYLLRKDPRGNLLGLDIEEHAVEVARQNALRMGLGARSDFKRADLWSAATLVLLNGAKPDLVVCNPPYVPEPPGNRMQIEAGAGPHGTAHVMRALELTRSIQAPTLALSWCSLAHPGVIVAAAAESGYELVTLYVTAIADGEYSGSVHDYLRDLPDCFISEQPETLEIVAPDGSARFAYLLLAGVFRRCEDPPADGPVEAVQKLCEDFAQSGIGALSSASAPFTLRYSVLNRWDELKLRVMLHGEVFRRDRTKL